MASEVKTNKVSPASGTTVTLGNSGDTISVASGATASGFLPSNISTSGDDFQFNSGYGSVATAYGCRAWVNFNGTGTVAIRDSGNVSSITDNGTGKYAVNFTNSMPDVNYASSSSVQKWNTTDDANVSTQLGGYDGAEQTVSSILVHVTHRVNTISIDSPQITVSIFR